MYLMKTGQTVLDMVGGGSITLAPPAMDWHITATTVTTTSVLRTRASTDIDGVPLEGTYSGNHDTSDTAYVVPSGSMLTCTWTGGTPGAAATLAIRGQQVPA
jgi:hypothetical protein